MKVQPLALSNPRNEASVVKRCALYIFRVLRSVTGQLWRTATKVATDIGEAWAESSRPNV